MEFPRRQVLRLAAAAVAMPALARIARAQDYPDKPVRIITHSVPWRYYLDVDVSPGTPGRGGPGCKGVDVDSRSQDSPDGPPGKLPDQP